MTKIFHILLAALLLASCGDKNENKPVTSRSDYESYLTPSTPDLSQLSQQLTLWQSKIEKEPDGFLYHEKLGHTYLAMFEKTREVNYLHKADSAYHLARQHSRGKWQVSSLLNLSSIAAKKHDFASAAHFAVQSREQTDQTFGPLLMQFDAEMELGNFQMAGAILDENKRMDSFDYLVRLSKYKDHEGNLDSAIHYMEQAKATIPAYQEERLVWATTNLADMYGHAGRIEDSYRMYLKALEMDPTFDYALKGIAWIAYSNDGNTIEAINLLETLRKRSAMPEYHLQLAELYVLEGHEEAAQRLKDAFVAEVSRPKYMGMYNKYLIELYGEWGAWMQAIALAEAEVAKRPTPATYDWLAWTLHQKGDTDLALAIYKEQVEGKTYEPDAIYHMGVVYDEMEISRGAAYLRESLDASYELGPKIAQEIKRQLKGKKFYKT